MECRDFTAYLPGPYTQLEMFQKRLKVSRRTLGHTPSLGVVCWLEVTDFDRFFGFLSLVLHVCYLSFAGCLWFVCLFFVARINNFHHGWNKTFEASRHLGAAFAADFPRHTVTLAVS